MTDIFGESFADAYDIVYGDKDYSAESEAVHRLIARHCPGPSKKLIDIGCGTGRHAAKLSERGFDVVCVDRSAAMLARAKQAIPERHDRNVAFVEADMRELALGREHDVAVSLFNVLGFMLGNDDLLAAFRSIRAQVRRDGIFIGEVWFGPAVIASPPEERRKEIQIERGRIVRASTTEHSTFAQTCSVSIITERHEVEKPTIRTEETQCVRYFYPLEIDLALRATGFHLLALTGFPDIDNAPSISKYPMAFVARAS